MPRDGSLNQQRILDTAQRLVIDNGFAATSVDQVIAEAGTSKGAFFHHFSSKGTLAAELVRRYAEADIAHLERALTLVADVADPAAKVDAFLRVFEDEADDLMGAQSSCLYVAALTEQGLIDPATAEPIRTAITVWGRRLSELLTAAADATPAPTDGFDAQVWADHVFVTFEGTFLLCRATGDPTHMRRQLRALRLATRAWLGGDEGD